MSALDDLKALLTDLDGNICISGAEADRHLIKKALDDLANGPNIMEGRRLFNVCVKHGATPGETYRWLNKRLSEGTMAAVTADNADMLRAQVKELADMLEEASTRLGELPGQGQFNAYARELIAKVRAV